MELDQLIEEAVADGSKEAALFHLLLDATLYVHAPKKHTGARLSLVQFKTPQGVMAIPVFTDLKKAEFAGRGNVRIVPLHARQLFSASLGANIVINPNDAWCILYPEEIRALLEGKTLGRKPEDIEAKEDLQLRPAQTPSAELIKLIEESLAPIETAQDAWLTEADDDERPSSTRYVLVVAAERPSYERIARSLTLAISNSGRSFEKTVDITFIEPGELQQAWLEDNSSCLIYRRLWLKASRTGVYGNA
ncbi:MAG: hypothetical protein DCF27_09495 [Lysobacteraceae bacterium]|nr:MAG: hypothetical protein DCF27_09495 [Xanthomonadaceae bacterium]